MTMKYYYVICHLRMHIPNFTHLTSNSTPFEAVTEADSKCQGQDQDSNLEDKTKTLGPKTKTETTQ